MLDSRWTPETSATATTPRFSRNSLEYNYQNSSMWIKDASYLRLKNIKLGYTFNNRALKKIGMSRLQLYVNCYNALTFDNLDYMDPEATPERNAMYPITQIFNLGVNITF